MSTQISAYISDETKAEVEAFVKRYGITKARLIEEALQHHLQALREIPSDLVVPSRLVVTEDSMKRVAARLASDEQPTPALRELMGNVPSGSARCRGRTTGRGSAAATSTSIVTSSATPARTSSAITSERRTSPSRQSGSAASPPSTRAS